MPEHSRLTRELIEAGLRASPPEQPFSERSPELQAAVNAYDDARRAVYGRSGEQPMSDANKAHLAPMILAAVVAYLAASRRSAA